MNNKLFLFIGLFLVFLAIGLRIFGVDWYSYVLIAGISLKVLYLTLGLINGSLAGGRYLVMLFAGIAMVGTGGFLKGEPSTALTGSLLMYAGFLLKAVSIVFMVVVGRRRRMQAKELMS
ncbi:hypothetical protein [Marinilabilia sp.]|uniref:hypothetical protein n=1 Tax=Marinilabilia sp. TaxID=2021252 RepID=UPI0025BC9149|nr:hypothetical protein [Marinilabilia sp.]